MKGKLYISGIKKYGEIQEFDSGVAVTISVRGALGIVDYSISLDPKGLLVRTRSPLIVEPIGGNRVLIHESDEWIDKGFPKEPFIILDQKGLLVESKGSLGVTPLSNNRIFINEFFGLGGSRHEGSE